MRTGRRPASWAVMIFLYMIVAAGSVFVLVPFAWTLSTSLQSVTELYQIPKRWIPRPPQWVNYREVLTQVPFGLYYFNTLKITVLNIAGTLAS
jgi:multiple sugar transport system permease protein